MLISKKNEWQIPQEEAATFFSGGGGIIKGGELSEPHPKPLNYSWLSQTCNSTTENKVEEDEDVEKVAQVVILEMCSIT